MTLSPDRTEDASLLTGRARAGVRFYDAWEDASDDERAATARARLSSLVTHARTRTRFYADRLDAYDARAEHPLAQVPLLTSTDLRVALPPASSDLLDAELLKEGCNVFQSGGTTGSPKSTFFSHQELELLTLHNARGFFACGLTRDDRVANLFAVGGLYMTFLHINRMLQE